MIKFIALMMIILSFAACSSMNKTSIFDIAQRTPHSVVKKTNDVTKEEANRILQNRYNYLRLMFEQSRDPYYGHPKWSDLCLAQNKIGNVVNTDKGLSSVSELFVDGKGNPGFCPENILAIKSYEVAFYCENEKVLYQVTINMQDAPDLNRVSLCK